MHLTSNEAIKFVQDRLDSHQWWMFPVATESGIRFVDAVEKAHYQGANSDRLVTATVVDAASDIPLMWLVFAAKSCMSPEQLSKLAGRPVSGDGSHDIIFESRTPVSALTWLASTFASANKETDVADDPSVHDPSVLAFREQTLEH